MRKKYPTPEKNKAQRQGNPGTVQQGDGRLLNSLGVTQSMEEVCNGKDMFIVRTLGSGSYGVVYLCQSIDSRNKIKKQALKVIDTEHADRVYVEKFLKRECEILLKLRHPFTIRIFDIFRRNKKFYFFMRYAENGDLLNLIADKGRVLETRARLWAGQLAKALEYLHSKHIAHRDIKCENILITSQGNIKLTDFGFATEYIIRNGRPGLLSTFCGTKHYASPEILSGTPYDPEKIDVWAFGVVVYLMLNGAVPFQGAEPRRILELQRKGTPKMAKGVSVSQDALNFFENVFEINPNKRWGIQRLQAARWFIMGPRGAKAYRYRDKPRYLDQPTPDEVAKNLNLLMGGQHPLQLGTSSFTSGYEVVPSFMEPRVPAEVSQEFEEKYEEFKKRKGRFRK